MNCISFPKMFTSGYTNRKYDYEATKECLYLLLHCECGEMFGDPEYGVKLKRYYFNQNNYILKDILINEIYTKINIFCPQLILYRKDIKIENVGKMIIGYITCKNNSNFKTDTYEIVLFRGDD